MTTMLEPRIVIELAEYQRCRREVPSPSEADLRLSERLADDRRGGRLSVRWLADGTVDITATSWVGVVRFSHIDVFVVPKLVGGNLEVLRMLDYAAGVHMLRDLPAERPLRANGRDLFDLVCLLLALGAQTIIRDGLIRDYRQTDDTIEVLRGRLRYRDQYMRRFGRLDQLECHFDEYDSDVPDNQLIAAALSIARGRAADPAIRASLGRLNAIMSEACHPPTADADWYESAIAYGRRNARYQSSHELSKLVLRGLAYKDLYDTSGGRVMSFLLDMNVVFEEFVTKLVKDALHGTPLDVSAQRRLHAVIRNDATGRSYTTIRPDLVVEDTRTGSAVPVDVKYKQYDDKNISTSDIYQTFLYAYALGTSPTDRRAGVLYPSTRSDSGVRLSIHPLGAPTAAGITSAGINVCQALETLATPSRAILFRQVRDAIAAVTGLAA